MFKDTKNKLSLMTITFHWVVALLFIGLVAVGLFLEELPRGDLKNQMMGMHQSIGQIFFVLAVLRIIHRLTQGFPVNLSKKPPLQEMVAKGIHYILLLATVLIPVAGMITVLGAGFSLHLFGMTVIENTTKTEWMHELGETIHGPAAITMIAVIVLHSAAAIKQQMVDKTLSRMMGRSV